MPTASTTFSRGSNYATTYGSSYTTSTVGRSGSASRRTGSLSNGYASPSVYRTSPLPRTSGLGTSGLASRPDYNYTSERSRASPLGSTFTRPGPLKADHTTGSYNTIGASTRFTSTRDRPDYPSGTSTLQHRNSRTDLDGVTRPFSGRRSSSIANLSLGDDAGKVIYPRARTESTDRFGPRPSSRRGSWLEDDLYRTESLRARQTEDRDGLGGRSGYTPSMSRESSPGTSNGVGLRGRQQSEGREEMSNSRFSSRSSSGSTSTNMKVKERDGGKVGLRNLGNTCFMSCVLQCLSNTRPLLEWCLKEDYILDINTTTSSMKGALVKAFAALMKSLWKDPSTESYVSPNAFKTQIQKFAPRFMGYAQQDCQEFLRYLLEGIHEDVNRVTVKPKPVVIDDNRLDSKNDAEKAKEYWNVYLKRDNSHILDIFVGQLKSELKFTECGHRSVTFDPFWDLSLPIPKGTSELSLDSCLRLFMKEEELEAEERPMCSKCKARRSCTKSFSIQRFPQILVIHLKRFSQERFGRKLSSLVDFPVKGLNLSDYSSGGAQKVTYDLYAVSEHSGGVHSGHYTAICKNPYSGDWHTFNDTQVSQARSNQTVSSEAYVLFYQLTSPAGRL